MEKNLKRLIIIIIVLIVIAICIGIFISNKNKKSSESIVNKTAETITQDELDDNNTSGAIIDSKIANMDESARLRAYFGKFIDAIETEDYYTAYNYLNDNYKSQYFNTIDEFSEYIKNKYPKNKIAVKYDNVERKGEIFLLEVTIYDSEDTSYSPLSQTVVIRENSVNNFTMSFSKIIEKKGRS